MVTTLVKYNTYNKLNIIAICIEHIEHYYVHSVFTRVDACDNIVLRQTYVHMSGQF